MTKCHYALALTFSLITIALLSSGTNPWNLEAQTKLPRVRIAVSPPYPLLARRAHISGKVVCEALINKDGTVEKVNLISGHPLLIDASIDAIRQWVFERTEGDFKTTIIFSFSFSISPREVPETVVRYISPTEMNIIVDPEPPKTHS